MPVVPSTSGFIAPCIPTRAVKPPAGPGWVHEIKHDGYRLQVRRDGDAVSAHSEWLDQFEEGNAAGGHTSEVEAIPRPAASPSSPRMTPRRFPTPWRADKIAGGYVVRDANGQALAYIYSRDNEAAQHRDYLSSDEFKAALHEAGFGVDRGRIVDVSGECPGFAVIPVFRNGVLNRNATLSKASGNAKPR
jgi:hypothetical protein